MKSNLEQEVKLGAGPDFRGVALEGRELVPKTLWSTYYDTRDCS